MHTTHTTLARSAAALGAALILGASLTACSAIDAVTHSTTDAWSVTYEVSVDTAEPTELSAVRYLDQATRTEEREQVKQDSVTATPRGGGDATWSVNSLVMVKDTTAIAATPPEDRSATCRILLDGEREISSETGGPGEPVSCEAVAPLFEK